MKEKIRIALVLLMLAAFALIGGAPAMIGGQSWDGPTAVNWNSGIEIAPEVNWNS